MDLSTFSESENMDGKTMAKKEKQGEKKEEKKEGKKPNILKRYPIIFDILFVVMIMILVLGAAYWQITKDRIYIDKAEIDAPIITLNSPTPGILDQIYVKEGDFVGKGKMVASVNGKSIYPKTSGIIVSVKNVPGQFVTAQDAIVQMIDPKELRVVGRIQEDKGLDQIKPGQKVIFTADAFGSREYSGFVDLVSPTSRQGDIVFSISSQRAENEFNIKVQFDVDKYPELKNGMSAKMWVYK